MDETTIEDSAEVVVPIVKEIIDFCCNEAENSVNEKDVIAHLHELGNGQLLQIFNRLIDEQNEISQWNQLLNKNTYKYFTRKKVRNRIDN